MDFDFDDLVAIYEAKKLQYGEKVYLHISDIFEEIREGYKEEYLASPKAARARAEGRAPDAEQSWKAFKGQSFERLIRYIIRDQLEGLGLRCIPGNRLERKSLGRELGEVYRQLLVRYNKWAILPDADLVIYQPGPCRVVGIVSCKITLRERVAQTAYWEAVE